MALLGGLLRGTSGAFIRGSLGAASDIMRETSARDDEKVETLVKNFGSKYDTYSKLLMSILLKVK